MRNDLANRLFQFSVKTITFLRTLPMNPENKIIRYQLAKSATSSGANYEEAQAGSSKADFIYKIEISLKEMRESNYWLRIINSVHKEDQIKKEDLSFLANESEELMKILGSIVKKTKDNMIVN